MILNLYSQKFNDLLYSRITFNKSIPFLVVSLYIILYFFSSGSSCPMFFFLISIASVLATVSAQMEHLR